MRKVRIVLVVLLVLLAVAGCTGRDRPSREAERPVPEVALPAPGEWVQADGGQVRITAWRWEDAPPNSAGRPAHGAWLILDLEVQAVERPVPVTVWEWQCMGAYDGTLTQAVASPLHAVLDTTIQAGVSLAGEWVACDPEPGQAVVVQWQQPGGPVLAWLVPARN